MGEGPSLRTGEVHISCGVWAEWLSPERWEGCARSDGSGVYKRGTWQVLSKCELHGGPKTTSTMWPGTWSSLPGQWGHLNQLMFVRLERGLVQKFWEILDECLVSKVK